MKLPHTLESAPARAARAGARKVLEKVGGKIMGLGRRLHSAPQEQRVRPWFADRGDQTLRVNYDLTSSSMVFDLGGYHGDWASEITARYRCPVHVFEPVAAFAATIEQRFAHNPDVVVHRFGLAPSDASMRIWLDEDATSLFERRGRETTIELRSITAFLAERHIDAIDLMKINIEGAEYDLLDEMIRTGVAQKVRDIQVQFHDFVPNAEARMRSIQHALARTHALTYQYEFVWENWRRQGSEPRP